MAEPEQFRAGSEVDTKIRYVAGTILSHVMDNGNQSDKVQDASRYSTELAESLLPRLKRLDNSVRGNAAPGFAGKKAATSVAATATECLDSHGDRICTPQEGGSRHCGSP